MDQQAYENLKESWADVEDRDGVRLSWNVFPSTRMVLQPASMTWLAHLHPNRKHRALLCLSAQF